MIATTTISSISENPRISRYMTSPVRKILSGSMQGSRQESHAGADQESWQGLEMRLFSLFRAWIFDLPPRIT